MRITLKKAYADGTIAVDMDPLSLLCRLATSVPPPRRHTIRYSGVLAPASSWRRGLAPMAPSEPPADGQTPRRPEGAPSYRPWAELLARTFAVDVLACPKCHRRMRLQDRLQVGLAPLDHLARFSRREVQNRPAIADLPSPVRVVSPRPLCVHVKFDAVTPGEQRPNGSFPFGRKSCEFGMLAAVLEVRKLLHHLDVEGSTHAVRLVK